MGAEGIHCRKVDEMEKFVAVMNIPSPYRLHLLGELARQLKERGVEFHCHFMNRGHKDRPTSWLDPKIDFPHTYWRNFGPDQHEFNPGLILRLMFSRPDYLMVGGAFDTLTAIALSLFARAKIRITWIEGNAKSPGTLTGLVGSLKLLTVSRYDLMAVPGRQGVAYRDVLAAHTLRKFPQTIILPNLIDESRFKVKAEGEQRDLKICIIPARFDPVKGLKELFRAVEPEMLDGWKLVVMGHGPEEEMTMQIVRERGLSDFVEVIHSVPYEEMPQHYASADLCLIPSVRDQNPLAAVEALHSGLPLALSDQAGNVDEAVTEGENGWALPVLDEKAFAEKLKVVFGTEKERLAEMGRVSKEKNARFWDTKAAIGRFIDCLGV